MFHSALHSLTAANTASITRQWLVGKKCSTHLNVRLLIHYVWCSTTVLSGSNEYDLKHASCRRNLATAMDPHGNINTSRIVRSCSPSAAPVGVDALRQMHANLRRLAGPTALTVYLEMHNGRNCVHQAKNTYCNQFNLLI